MNSNVEFSPWAIRSSISRATDSSLVAVMLFRKSFNWFAKSVLLAWRTSSKLFSSQSLESIGIDCNSKALGNFNWTWAKYS